ncbi:MAG: 30S ribosomal protein S3 [Lentisphaerae bacterium]|nr:MAG: 30S ribosomal protein S3 [Lentisphaerota bacterium]
MGQKVNPIAFRVAVTKDWRSRWFARKDEFGDMLLEDLKLREFVKKRLQHAAVGRIQIERFANRIRITVHTARPGVVFGRRRQDLDNLKLDLQRIAPGKEIYLDVVEIRKLELNAQLVAESVAQQIERRVSFRRAMKKAIQAAMDMGALGIRIRVAGRLNGAELARTEQHMDGSVPLHTLRANIDYGFTEANTPAGKIGVKTWIHLPETFDKEQTNASNAKKGQVSKNAKRKSSR